MWCSVSSICLMMLSLGTIRWGMHSVCTVNTCYACSFIVVIHCFHLGGHGQYKDSLLKLNEVRHTLNTWDSQGIHWGHLEISVPEMKAGIFTSNWNMYRFWLTQPLGMLSFSFQSYNVMRFPYCSAAGKISACYKGSPLTTWSTHPTPHTHRAQNSNETFPEHWIGWGRLMIGLPIHPTSCLWIFCVGFSDSVNCSEWGMKWRSSLISHYLSNVRYFVLLSTPIHFFQSTSKVVLLSSCCIHFDLLYVGMNTMLMIFRFWMKYQMALFVLHDYESDR